MTLNRKIAYIDLTTGRIETASIPGEIREKYLGGRGLGTYLLYNHLQAGADPLAADNIIVLSTGLLAATPGSASSPLHVCTKSPLTGYYGSYSGSSQFSAELRWAGYDHVVIRGKSETPVYISIRNNQITLKDASALQGKNIAETQAAIRSDLADNGVTVIAIGPAGEKLVKLAGIFSGPGDTDYGAGIGTVMGSKNLKAVAVRGNGELALAKPREALEYNYKLTAQITTPVGTGQHPDVKNPLDSVFDPSSQIADSVTGYNTMLNVLLETDIAAMHGLDPVETMNAIAWMINLYEEDIITDDDTNGLTLKWENTQDLLELVRQIAEKQGAGSMLAGGCMEAALRIGKESGDLLMQVKGTCISPAVKLTPATALNLVTSSSNSEFSKNRLYPDLSNLPEPVLQQIVNQPVRYEGTLTADESLYEGKAWQVFWRENSCMTADSLGVNDYHGIIEGYVYPNYEQWAKMISLTAGINMTPVAVWTAAERSLNIERMFNIREGMTAETECLPQSYYEKERLTPSPGISINEDKLKKLVTQYYTLHGWGDDGIPGKETLKKLSIDNEPSHRL